MNKEIYIRLEDGARVIGDSLEAGVAYELLNAPVVEDKPKKVSKASKAVKAVKKAVKKKSKK